jgi:hypothetical protein
MHRNSFALPGRSRCPGGRAADSNGDGYTFGMKTAISIPDDVFLDAELLAHKTKKSRSEIYSRAVREYVARYSEDGVTDALDALYDKPAESDEFGQAAARNALGQVEW